MKAKLLIIAALCAVAVQSNAQTEKGKSLIGGNVGFETYSQKNGVNTQKSKINSTTVSPRIGYFFSKNLAIGLTIGYNDSKNISDGPFTSGNSTLYTFSETKSHSFGGGPFVRYYTDLAEKFKFFGQLDANISFGKSTQEFTITPSQGNNSKSNYKTTNFIGAINPGFAFFPSKKWAIEFSFPLLSYSNYHNQDDGTNPQPNDSRIEGFSFGLSSFNPQIGFNYHF